MSNEIRGRLRTAVGKGVNTALASGRRLPFGGAPARAVSRALAPQQPAAPRPESSLASMFSTTQPVRGSRNPYGGGG